MFGEIAGEITSREQLLCRDRAEAIEEVFGGKRASQKESARLSQRPCSVAAAGLFLSARQAEKMRTGLGGSQVIAVEPDDFQEAIEVVVAVILDLDPAFLFSMMDCDLRAEMFAETILQSGK